MQVHLDLASLGSERVRALTTLQLHYGLASYADMTPLHYFSDTTLYYIEFGNINWTYCLSINKSLFTCILLVYTPIKLQIKQRSKCP